MFVSNKTPYKVVLRRTHLDERTGAALVIVHALFDVGADGALAPRAPRDSVVSDPPDTSDHLLWKGVSVTATGAVSGPPAPPFRRALTLDVGSERRELVVHGPRCWVRGPSGDLVPSAPTRFDALPLEYSHAFGGGYEVPPGPLPDSGLPHPGGQVVDSRNPGGVGLYPGAAAAEGRPLPCIEWADAPIRTVADRPEPAGFAPCPQLVGLRLSPDALQMRPLGGKADSGARATVSAAFPEMWARLAHHAHGRLIFEGVAPGTRVVLWGLGVGTMMLAVPDLRCSVFFADSPGAASPRGKSLRWSLRAIHLEADRREALFTYGATATYPSARPPRWVVVSPSLPTLQEARR